MAVAEDLELGHRRLVYLRLIRAYKLSYFLKPIQKIHSTTFDAGACLWLVSGEGVWERRAGEMLRQMVKDHQETRAENQAEIGTQSRAASAGGLTEATRREVRGRSGRRVKRLVP